MTVSITNTAALLAMFPKFFLNEKFDFWALDYLNPHHKRKEYYA